MLDRLNQERIITILTEAKRIGDSNHSISTKKLVEEIEKMILHKEVKCS